MRIESIADEYRARDVIEEEDNEERDSSNEEVEEEENQEDDEAKPLQSQSFKETKLY